MKWWWIWNDDEQNQDRWSQSQQESQYGMHFKVEGEGTITKNAARSCKHWQKNVWDSYPLPSLFTLHSLHLIQLKLKPLKQETKSLQDTLKVKEDYFCWLVVFPKTYLQVQYTILESKNGIIY